METLYQKNQKGSIQVFKVIVKAITEQVIENGITFPVITVSIIKTWGQLDGKMQTQTREIKGKNIGKSNFTTPTQQAVKEAKAIQQKKKDEGYKSLSQLNIDKEDNPMTWKTLLEAYLPAVETDGEGRVKPMLLYEARTENFPKELSQRKKAKRKDVKYPCTVQVKMDGVCTIATPGNVLSTRGGKDRHTPKGQKWDDIVPHIVSELTFLWKKLKEKGIKDYIFHGEVYKHGLTLQEIQKANKKANKDSKNMEFNIFDIVAPEIYQLDRLKVLTEISQIAGECNLKYIKFIPYHIVRSEKDIFNLENKYLDLNYEGIIIRHNDGKYKIGGRSKDVLKMVRMDKSYFFVVGVEPLEKDPTMGKFVCKHKENVFYITPGKGYNHQDRRDLILNPHNYINKMIPVIHRGYTDDGIPRIATSPKE